MHTSQPTEALKMLFELHFRFKEIIKLVGAHDPLGNQVLNGIPAKMLLELHFRFEEFMKLTGVSDLLDNQILYEIPTESNSFVNTTQSVNINQTISSSPNADEPILSLEGIGDFMPCLSNIDETLLSSTDADEPIVFSECDVLNKETVSAKDNSFKNELEKLEKRVHNLEKNFKNKRIEYSYSNDIEKKEMKKRKHVSAVASKEIPLIEIKDDEEEVQKRKYFFTAPSKKNSEISPIEEGNHIKFIINEHHLGEPLSSIGKACNWNLTSYLLFKKIDKVNNSHSVKEHNMSSELQDVSIQPTIYRNKTLLR